MMNKEDMMKTIENLRKALSGEVQACIRYLGFAEKADEGSS